MLFSPSYSSEFNPIERLWSLTKRNFNRSDIFFENKKNRDLVQRLVMESVKSYNKEALAKHVIRCMQRMRDYIAGH